ncbi:MAG: phosphosulfolactate phosphohydrolase [Salana multivorans]|uniref:phosphosulfolactate phosphohydrolase n=1 Tax=Salana multivorans TaxID=120377 RepID=UPI000967F71F|nr:phosphosulfolactate phosphohydrolase [Salana multivorans]MBN8880708.1 phosphosulfolactate phosphohydrolase [Salana multivorans]OJX97085.1 MAG: hypothetical protein BGO96_02745 [Micrococcales bacterium 73-15]
MHDVTGDGAFAQASYQVRFDWGRAGLRRLAPCDVVVVVDVLGEAEDAAREVVTGLVPPDALVLRGGLRNAAAVARACLDEQARRGGRTSIGVVAVGGAARGEARDDAGEARFAVEDLLGAGAVVAALTDLGIDHSSPEAAVACEGFLGLRRALGHLLISSGSGRAIVAADPAALADVHDAARLDADDDPRPLRG